MEDEWGNRKENIDLKDVFQIAAGALAAAVVFAPNQDLLNIAQNLPFSKAFFIVILSLAVSGLIAYKIGARRLNIDEMQTIGNIIPLRIIVIYIISSLSCLFVLWMYDIINIHTDLMLIAKQVIVLSLIACGSGTMVDLAYSKNK